MHIVGIAQVERGIDGQVSLIPNVFVNGKEKSPSLLDPDFMRDDFGWKTFSCDF